MPLSSRSIGINTVARAVAQSSRVDDLLHGRHRSFDTWIEQSATEGVRDGSFVPMVSLNLPL